MRISLRVILLICYGILLPFNMYSWRCLEIVRNNEEAIHLNISNDLELSFTTTHMEARTNEYTMEIPLENIEEMIFLHNIFEKDDIETGSRESKNSAKYILLSQQIIFSQPQNIKIFSSNGIPITAHNACDRIDFSSLSPGIYLISTDFITFKIQK